MPTQAGYLYIVAVTVLFSLWIYGAVSLYFDLRYQYLPRLYRWVRRRGEDKRHLL